MDSTVGLAQDAILDALRPVIDGIAATLGSSCEVVLHDYRQPDHSVVAIAGEVTHRRVGGSMSEIGLAVLARGDHAENELNYVAAVGSQVVKSSTLPLRGPDGVVFGAVCINLDVTALRQVGDLLAALTGDATSPPAPTTFTDDFDEVVDSVLRAEAARLGKPIESLSRPERIDLVAALDRRGLFDIRNAAARLTGRLGISRSALYADLASARTNKETP